MLLKKEKFEQITYLHQPHYITLLPESNPEFMVKHNWKKSLFQPYEQWYNKIYFNH